MTSTAESHDYAELVKPNTNNATHIGWYDSDWDCEEEWTTDFHPISKKEYFELLDRMNQGLNNGYRTNRPYETYRANRDLVAALSDQLEMVESDRSRAIQWFTQLDLQRLGFPVEVVALSVCAYVVHNGPADRDCHPVCKVEDKLLSELREKLRIRKELFRKVYGKVEHRISNQRFSRVEFDRYQTDRALRFEWSSTCADADDGWL